MSNLTKQCEQECTVLHESGAVELIIEPREKPLGGFSVRRVLPNVERRMVGPWIFFDHMGPADFAAGEGVNVRPHPHIGIATVTYLFDGEMLHRDSLGSEQLIRPGDINLMVAGRGIVHSERERPEIKSAPHTAHGLQLWLALPESREEMEPAFYHYSNGDIPSTTIGDVPVRLMMGNAYGMTSSVATYADTLYLEAHLQIGETLTLPPAQERAVYVVQGSLQIDGWRLSEHSMAILRDQSDITVKATTDTRLVLIGGESFNKRYIEWNFVSSRLERIEQAKQDWKNGTFPSIPGDRDEYIPLPE